MVHHIGQSGRKAVVVFCCDYDKCISTCNEIIGLLQNLRGFIFLLIEMIRFL